MNENLLFLAWENWKYRASLPGHRQAAADLDPGFEIFPPRHFLQFVAPAALHVFLGHFLHFLSSDM